MAAIDLVRGAPRGGPARTVGDGEIASPSVAGAVAWQGFIAATSSRPSAGSWISASASASERLSPSEERPSSGPGKLASLVWNAASTWRRPPPQGRSWPAYGSMPRAWHRLPSQSQRFGAPGDLAIRPKAQPRGGLRAFVFPCAGLPLGRRGWVTAIEAEALSQGLLCPAPSPEHSRLRDLARRVVLAGNADEE